MQERQILDKKRLKTTKIREKACFSVDNLHEKTAKIPKKQRAMWTTYYRYSNSGEKTNFANCEKPYKYKVFWVSQVAN